MYLKMAMLKNILFFKTESLVNIYKIIRILCVNNYVNYLYICMISRYSSQGLAIHQIV